MKNDNELEIYTIPKYEGNAYIMETIDGYFYQLWTAPLFKNETADNSQWSIVEDEQIINDVIDSSERTIIDEITVEKFVSFLDQENLAWDLAEKWTQEDMQENPDKYQSIQSDNQDIFIQEEEA